MRSLRASLIHLAYSKPDLRPHLLPLLKTSARAPAGTPTSVNISAGNSLLKEYGGAIPDRIDSVHFSHIKRLIAAGWLERTPRGWVPTDAGRKGGLHGAAND